MKSIEGERKKMSMKQASVVVVTMNNGSSSSDSGGGGGFLSFHSATYLAVPHCGCLPTIISNFMHVGYFSHNFHSIIFILFLVGSLFLSLTISLHLCLSVGCLFYVILCVVFFRGPFQFKYFVVYI